MNDFEDAFVGIVGAAFLILLLITAIVVSAFALPFIAIGVVVIAGVYKYYHSESYLERQSQKHTAELYQKAKGLVGYSETTFATKVHGSLPAVPHGLAEALVNLTLKVYELENFGEVPPPPPVCNSIEGGRYRDRLSSFVAKAHDDSIPRAAIDALIANYQRFIRFLPDLSTEGDLATAPMHYFMKPHDLVDSLAYGFYEENAVAAGLFKTIRDQLDRNIAEVNIPPDEYPKDDVVEVYLKHTPLYDVFQAELPVGLPERVRYEHQWVIGGTGHGKTQTLQYLISKDLEKDCSIVVIDSKNQLIPRIAALKSIPKERLVIIDADDIEYPVSLNLFDVGIERINALSPLDRERTLNGIIELYDYVFGSLLGAGMTSKQSTAFRFVTRLMIHIPDATILTLVKIFEPGGLDPYRQYVSELPTIAQSFFTNEFDGKEFRATKEQVLRRLYGVLGTATFERMFANPRSKLDLFAEMNAGKVILINTSKATLKQTGTEIFGRFFIAMIGLAIQLRAPTSKKMPTYVYVDECEDYVKGADTTITDILSQAREQKVGTIWAHQYVGQLDQQMQQCFAANTSIKFAGGVSAKDARFLAPDMHTTTEFIQAQPKLTFAAYIKGTTPNALPLRFPFGHMEAMEERDDMADLKAMTRAKYAEKYQPRVSEPEIPEPQPEKASGADNPETDRSTDW